MLYERGLACELPYFLRMLSLWDSGALAKKVESSLESSARAPWAHQVAEMHGQTLLWVSRKKFPRGIQCKLWTVQPFHQTKNYLISHQTVFILMGCSCSAMYRTPKTNWKTGALHPVSQWKTKTGWFSIFGSFDLGSRKNEGVLSESLSWIDSRKRVM